MPYQNFRLEGKHDEPGGSQSEEHVGSRAPMRRLMLGMSQEKRGHTLWLTFKLVQNYEKGTN
jgi:hypothetical protein